MTLPARSFCIGVLAALLSSAAAEAQVACSTHVVVAGDNLRSIARTALGDADLFRAIYNANVDVIGPKADLILVGATLVIPCDAAGTLPTGEALAAVTPDSALAEDAALVPLNSVPLATEVIDPAKVPLELVPELPFVIVGAPVTEADQPSLEIAAEPTPEVVVEPAPEVIVEAPAEPAPEVEVAVTEAPEPLPEPEPAPVAEVQVEEVPAETVAEAPAEVVAEVVPEVVPDPAATEAPEEAVAAVAEPAALETPVVETPVAETPVVDTAAVEPTVAPAASGDDAMPLRLLTGNDYAPFADEMLPGGGMITQLVEMAIFRADPAIPYNLTFINDWQAHIDALLPSQAYDLSFPWLRPDCETNDMLSAGDQLRCDTFVFSTPLYEIVDGYFARADSPLIDATSYVAFEGTRICRPEGYTTGVLDAAGLSAPKVELLRPVTALDCFEALAANKVDLVSIDAEVGDSAIAELGLIGQFAQNPHLTTFLSLHVIAHKSNPRAVAMIEQLNGGIVEMYESGEWYDIVSSALTKAALAQ